MKCNFVFLLLLCMFSDGVANTHPSIAFKNSYQNFDQTDELLQSETLIIFDLSKNVITKQVFDISVKYFLNLILQHCNGFKYVIIDDNVIYNCDGSDACIIVIYDCKTNACQNAIENMDYIYFTSSYPDTLLDPDFDHSLHYYRFLNRTFGEISDSPVILLTNRIVTLDPNYDLDETLKNRGINLTAILLGHNDTNSTALLENTFQNIQNVRTMSLANYDCLSYLFYCILPCLTDIPECLKVDLDNCHQFSILTPNNNPKETLHAWFVFDLLVCSNNDDSYYFCHMNMTTSITEQVRLGLQSYAHMYNISHVRAYFVVSGGDTITLENIYTSGYTLYINGIIWSETADNIVNDDINHSNQRLSLIPWSGTLAETRIGILSIIYITNYATKALKTILNGESLFANMYEYNENSFRYYETVLPNRTNFYIYHSLNQQNYIVINPIQNGVPLPTLPPVPTESVEKTSKVTTLSFRTTKILRLTSSVATKSTMTTFHNNTENPSSKSNTIIIVAGIFGGIALIIIGVGVSIYCIKIRQRKAIVDRMQIIHGDRSARGNVETSIKDEWELTWQNLTIENNALISANENLRVKKGRLFDTDQKFINVVIKITDSNSTAVKNRFFGEINMMKKINGRNNNIVKMLGYITISHPICLVLEFCENFDLLRFVQEQKYVKEGSFEVQKNMKKQFFIFAWQIAHGMEFLALNGILHRNLMAKNVLIDSEKNAKISNFNLAAFQHSDVNTLSPSDKVKLSSKWLALETLEDYIFSFKSEIWTFAIVLFEMYTFGEIPYEDISREELFALLKTGKRLDKPAFCSTEIYDLMLKCWMEDPESRPSIKEVIKIYKKNLENSTEGYGYLELLQTQICSTNKELIRQFSSYENYST